MNTNADAWLRDVLAAVDDVLVPGLDRAAVDAARAGVWAAQQDHPYTDRTQNLTNTAEPVPGPAGRGEAEMVWVMPYAGFVDEGTSHARPYPFTPIARRAAGRALERGVADAASALSSALSG